MLKLRSGGRYKEHTAIILFKRTATACRFVFKDIKECCKDLLTIIAEPLRVCSPLGGGGVKNLII